MKAARTPNWNNLVNIMSEFLESAIVVGYDFEGNRVRLECLKTDKDLDAIQQLLEDSANKLSLPNAVVLQDGEN